MTAPRVISLGCRLNAHEAAAMSALSTEAGLGEAVVVNTCAVTNEAVRQARQTIRRARRERPDARIVVTGCAAQIDPAGFSAMTEVDAVIGNGEKLDAGAWRGLAGDLLAGAEPVRVNDIFAVEETAGHLLEAANRASGMDQGRARAFLQVQNGCDHRCTFCIIPYGRGNSRSVPMGAVVDHAARLVDAGYREIVLTGVDMTSYGADLPGAPKLGTLVGKILDRVPGLARLRLSSIDVAEVDDALFERVTGDDRVAPHLHLSLQAGDDMILKRMKRRHTRAQAIAFCDAVRARRPEVAFGADLIAGFPTETEEMAANTRALVEDCGLAYTHVFPFSPRDGAPAARMPQHPKAVVKERAARLRETADRMLTAFLDAHVGREADVLIERGGRGRLADFAEAEFDAAPTAREGEIVLARIAARRGARLLAAPL